MNYKLQLAAALLTVFSICSCNNDKADQKKSVAEEKKVNSKDSVKPNQSTTASVKPPVLNIIDTVSLRRIVLCLKDSAATMEGVGTKLAAVYGKVSKIAADGKCNISGAPMAWYKTQKAPYFFEAGLPVDKKPVKIPAGLIVKEIGQEPVMVAHFFGPYDLLPQAYEALKDWTNSQKKVMNGEPYEIYVGDPAVQKDPYKVQTDVVFPIK
jgi:effector-binding domain-containing protein